MERPNFTRIELLIVGLVIGVLGVVAVFSIMNARAQARDAVRLSDVRQVQAGLELYFNDSSVYPSGSDALAIGTPSTVCLSDAGFSSSCNPATETVYLDTVPATPKSGLNGAVECGESTDVYCYFSNGEAYMIEFELEKNNNLLGLQKGLNCATELGFDPGACSMP